MDLTVVDVTGNKSEEVSMPDTVAAGRVIPKVVELLQLPVTGPDGMPLVYKFHHRESGRQINDGDTLADAGVADSDTLRIVPEITAG
jgi:hypothetical protein